MTASSPPVVAVVGGGIAGLAAAWELVAGSDPSGGRPLEVHLFESAERIGGKVRSTEFGGRRVDLAADAFLARRPEATDLCAELGVEGRMVPVGALGASIWARGRLRMMPAGLNLGVPTRWFPLLRSGILSPMESVRVAKDLFGPHLRTGMAFGDRSVGQIVEERLGRPVVERLVDPLIGGIHAGGVDELSAAATFPHLLAASHQSGSLMRRMGMAMARSSRAAGGTVAAAGAAPAAPQPAFWTLAGSTASLADLLAAALVDRGVTVHTGTRVRSLDRPGTDGTARARWRLALARSGRDGGDAGLVDGRSDGRSVDADGVVLALPAGEAAGLLVSHAPVAAGLLGDIMYASVAVVTLRFAEGSVRTPLAGSGFLVPRTSTVDGRPPLVTGVTYLSRKWPHLARPGDELIRASVGRFGDARHTQQDDGELTASVLEELARFLDIDHPPLEGMVTRWDHALPQYGVGHLVRVGRIEQSVSGLDAVAVAGAALRGVGIPACVGSGRAAGRQVRAALHAARGPA